jgi:hypothetical protein
LPDHFRIAALRAAVLAVTAALASCSGGSDPDPGPTCTPAAEARNGLDDDCDGAVDDGLATICAGGDAFCSDAVTVSLCNAEGTWFDPAEDTTCAYQCQDGACVPEPDDDGDGIPNGSDRCPLDPDTTCALISQLRHWDVWAVPIGSDVTVRGIVTAMKGGTSARAMWIQETGAAEYGGIEVYFSSAPLPAVAPGNTVQVTGRYTEFFGVSMIEPAPVVTVTVVDTTSAVPDPIFVATPARIATGGDLGEALEGMLVQVQNVTVTVANPDSPSNFDEFAVTDGLRVDDLILDNGVNNGWPSYTVGTTFTSLTGILHFQFSNTKLEPRSAADLVP